MTAMPEPQARQPHATQAGQPAINDAAQRFLADLESAYLKQPLAPTPTFFRDVTPVPAIGTAPPVAQPGIPPQSRAAVDYAVRVLSTSVASVLFGGSASLVMVASGYANPTVIAWVCVGAVALPPAIAFPVLAVKSLMKSAKDVVQAAPPEVHNHYSGNVRVYEDHRTVNTRTSGIVASTRNQLPTGRPDDA